MSGSLKRPPLNAMSDQDFPDCGARHAKRFTQGLQANVFALIAAHDSRFLTAGELKLALAIIGVLSGTEWDIVALQCALDRSTRAAQLVSNPVDWPPPLRIQAYSVMFLLEAQGPYYLTPWGDPVTTQGFIHGGGTNLRASKSAPGRFPVFGLRIWKRSLAILTGRSLQGSRGSLAASG